MAPIVSAIVSCRAAIGAVRRRLLVIALAVTAAWAMPSTRAEAQGQSAAALKAQVSRILRQPQAPSAEEQKMLEDYFAKSFFPSMTDESPEQLGQLAEKRKDLFVQYINVRGSQAARDQLLAITMKSVGQGIAIRNYHPAIRFNAVLILGQLDKESARSGSGAPVPYPAATNALIFLLERDEFGGVPVPSSVKVAALIGLDRHTRLGADSQFSDRITSTALAVAQQQEKPDDLSPAAHDWMRRLAARVLMNQYAKGLTPPVNQALSQLVGSKSVSLDDRCSVAETLQKAMFEGAQGVDAGVMAQAIGRLASDVLSYEAKQARKYQRELLEGDGGASSFGGGLARGPMGGEGFGGRGLEGGGRGFGGFPGEGFGGGIGGFGAEVDEGPRIEKRRLLDRLKAVADGADAIAAGSSDETKERMSALAAPVRRVFNDSSGNNATDVSIAKAVVGLSQEVEALVADWAPPAEEEPAEEDAAAAIDEAAEAPAETEPAAADAEAPAAEEAPAN